MDFISSGEAVRLSEPAQFVSAEACRRVLDWREATMRLRAAYSTPHPAGASPMRVMARGPGKTLRVLAAAPPDSRMMGLKVFGYGAARQTTYAILLVDDASGQIKAIVDGAMITALRTSVTSALAVEALAPDRPAVLALLGSGLEARSHLMAISSCRPISSVRIYSPTPANREACAKAASEALAIPCVAAETPQSAVEGADIVVAAARSRDEKPILFGEWLADEVVVVSIGSTTPDQREIDFSVAERCDLIVCDAVEEVMHETGDMIAARAAGVAMEHKAISLNDLLCGKAAGRPARRPLFKSVGSGLQDVVVAELAFERALAAGLAQPLPEGFYIRG